MGYNDFVDILGRLIKKLDYIKGSFYMNFKVFSLGQGTKWGIFIWVAKMSNIYLGAGNS